MFENFIMQTGVDFISSIVGIIFAMLFIGGFLITFILRNFKHKLTEGQIKALETTRDAMAEVYKDKVKVHNGLDIVYSMFPAQARQITDAESVRLATLRKDVEEVRDKIIKLNSIISSDPEVAKKVETIKVTPELDLTNKWEETTGEAI